MAEFVARIKPKRSTVAGETPNPSDLQVAELAVNTADGTLFTKHTDGSVKSISGGGGSGGGGASIESIGNVQQRTQTRTDILSWDVPDDTSATGGWQYDTPTSRLTLNKEAKNGYDIRLDVVSLPATGTLFFSIDGTTPQSIYESIAYTNLAISGDTVTVDLLLELPSGGGEVPVGPTEIWISFDPVTENAPSQDGDVLVYDVTDATWDVTSLTTENLQDVDPGEDGLKDGQALVWDAAGQKWVQGYPKLSSGLASDGEEISRRENGMIGSLDLYPDNASGEADGFTAFTFTGDDTGYWLNIPTSFQGVQFFGVELPARVWLSTNGAITWDVDETAKNPIGNGDLAGDGVGQTFWLSLFSQDCAGLRGFTLDNGGAFTIRLEYRIPFNGSTGCPVEVTFFKTGGLRVAYGQTSFAFTVSDSHQGIYLDDGGVVVAGWGTQAQSTFPFYWEFIPNLAEGQKLEDLADVEEPFLDRAPGSTLVFSDRNTYEQRPLRLDDLGDVNNVGTPISFSGVKWNQPGNNGQLSGTASYFIPGGGANYFSFDATAANSFDAKAQMDLLQVGDAISFEDEDGTVFDTTVFQVVTFNAGTTEWYIRVDPNWSTSGLNVSGFIIVRSARFDSGNVTATTAPAYTDRAMLRYDEAKSQWDAGFPKLSELEDVAAPPLLGYSWTISKSASTVPASGIVEVGGGWDLFFSGYSSDSTDHRDAFQAMQAGQALTILVDGVQVAETTIEQIGNNSDADFTGGQYRTSIRIPDADEGWMAATTNGQTLTAFFPGFIEQEQAPSNGASLLYDAAAGKWAPGSGGFSVGVVREDPARNLFNFRNSNQTPEQAGHWYWGYGSRGWIDVAVWDAEYGDDLITDLPSTFYLRKDGGDWITMALHSDGVVTLGDSVRIYVDASLPDTFMDGVEVIEIAQDDPAAQPTRDPVDGDRLEYRDGAWRPTPGGAPVRSFVSAEFSQLQPGEIADIEFAQTGRAGQFLELLTTGEVWVTIYSDPDSRAADVSRVVTEAPERGSGVLLEYVASDGEETSENKVTPVVGYFNAEVPERPHLYARVRNIGSTPTQPFGGLGLVVVKTEP